MSLSNPYYVGLQNVGSYQVSGIPFVTSSITAPVVGGTPVEVSFPQVTQRIFVQNNNNQDLRVGFSSNGVKDGNYFLVHKHGSGTPSHLNALELRVKVSSIYLLCNDASNTTTVSVAAELTNIDTGLLELSGPSGSNWSGSLGVG